MTEENNPNCECGYHPHYQHDKFDITMVEFGMLEETTDIYEEAICKSCSQKFKRTIKQTLL